MNRRQLLVGIMSILTLLVPRRILAATPTADATDSRLKLVDKALEIADSYGFSISEKAGMFGLEPHAAGSVTDIRNFAERYLPRDLFSRAEYVIGIEQKRNEDADYIVRYPLDQPHPNLAWKSLRDVLTTGTYHDVWHAAAVYGCDVHGDLD
jgi:hypothetical protein